MATGIRSRRVPVPVAMALGWLLIFAIWAGVAATNHFPDYIVPTPEATWNAFVDQDEMVTNLVVTLKEVLLGLGIATVGAVLWAVAIVYFRRMRQMFYPLLVAAQTAPKEALAPLLVIWFGFSIWGKAVMASLIAFFPILVAVVGGLERFDARQQLLARSIGTGPYRTFFSFRAWSALPSFFSSLRLGVTLAVIGAVLGEYLGADQGIGHQLVQASQQLDGGLLYASLIALIAITGVLVGVIDVVERLVLRHRRGRDRWAA